MAATDPVLLSRQQAARRRQELLAEQLRGAQGLSETAMGDYSSPLGAGLGAVAHVLRAGLGQAQVRSLTDQLRALGTEQDAAELQHAQQLSDPTSAASVAARQPLIDLGLASPAEAQGVPATGVDTFAALARTRAEIRESEARRVQQTEQFAKQIELSQLQLAAQQGNKEAQQKLELMRLQMTNDVARASLGLRERELGLKATQGEAKANADKKQRLPANEAALLGETQTALAALDDLSAQFDALDAGGWTGKVKALIGDKLGIDTDPATYMAQFRATAQVAGKILEGGKLQAADESKYTAMLPVPGTPRERKLAQIATVKRLVLAAAHKRLRAFREAGYDVDNITLPPLDEPGSPTAPSAAPAAAQAKPDIATRIRQLTAMGLQRADILAKLKAEGYD